jgi:hypothetical protein
MDVSLTPAQAHRRLTQLVNYEDGLWDIMLGLVFLALSVFPATREILGPVWNMVLFLIVLAALAAGLGLARRTVSAPRLGRVRMRHTPQKAILSVLLGLTLSATLGLLFVTLRNPQWIADVVGAMLPGWAGDLFVDVIAMAMVVAVFSVMGYLSRVGRLFLYGWLIGLGNLASTALTHYAGVAFNLPLAVASIVIVAIGVVLLARFLRKYPVHTLETPE